MPTPIWTTESASLTPVHGNRLVLLVITRLVEGDEPLSTVDISLDQRTAKTLMARTERALKVNTKQLLSADESSPWPTKVFRFKFTVDYWSGEIRLIAQISYPDWDVRYRLEVDRIVFGVRSDNWTFLKRSELEELRNALRLHGL